MVTPNTPLAPNTLAEFNNWTVDKQLEFINYETGGLHYPNFSGILSYKQGFNIRYSRGKRGHIKSINEVDIREITP